MVASELDPVDVLVKHLQGRAVLWLHLAQCVVEDGRLVIRTPYESAHTALNRFCPKELSAAAKDLTGKPTAWDVLHTPKPAQPANVTTRRRELF